MTQARYLHHLAVCSPADTLFVVVAHEHHVGRNAAALGERVASPFGTGLSASLKPRLCRVFPLRASIPDAPLAASFGNSDIPRAL